MIAVYNLQIGAKVLSGLVIELSSFIKIGSRLYLFERANRLLSSCT